MTYTMDNGFSLTINDPNSILGSNLDPVVKNVNYATSLLSKYINFTKPLDFLIDVKPSSENQSSADGLMPSIVKWADYSGSKTLVPIIKSQSGLDLNGSEADGGFIIYAAKDGTLKNFGSPFYFDPGPITDSPPILPAGMTDFIGVVVHELFHSLGIASWEQEAAPLDKLIKNISGVNFYTSNPIKTLLGNYLPISPISKDHFGNDSLEVKPVHSGLMYQWGNYEQNRLDIGQIELQILKDLGYSVKNYDNLPLADPIDKFNITGTANGDVITADIHSSIVSSLSGDDKINLPNTKDGRGNYFIKGGDGIDSVMINESIANYGIVKSSDNLLLQNMNGPNGVSLLNSIEKIQFNDTSLIYDISNTTDNALVYRLYQAAFARTPDEGGLRYWIDTHNKGVSINDIASGFLNSAEFKQKYGASSTNSQLVDLLYKNILGREGEAGGVKYWNSALDSGQSTKETVLIGFAGSPENVRNTASHIDNGYWVL